MNFDFLFQIFGTVMSFLYDIRASYGFMIIGLTLIVMVIVTPLTLKATRSMLMMQQLQPEMKKLQTKYKDDRQKLNEELLKFYKENNINPVGGCLPLLVQMPVFFVLYAVLRGLTLRFPETGSHLGWSLGQNAAGVSLTKTPTIVHNFDPQYLPAGNLSDALHSTSTLPWLGMNLADSCQSALGQGILKALPYLALIAIVAVTGVVQQRQIQGRNQNAQINPQQQQIMKIMPFFLPVFSFALPAGLVLYFAVSNLYRVGQQWFISRSIYGVKSEGGSFMDRISSVLAPGSGSAARTASAEGADTSSAGRGASGRSERLAKAGSTKAGSTKGAASPARGKAGASARGGIAKPAPAAKVSSAKSSTRSSSSAEGETEAKANGRKADSGRTARSARRDQSPSRTNSASRPSSRPESTRKKPSPTAEGSSTTQPPTLQPRARKNKKR